MTTHNPTTTHKTYREYLRERFGERVLVVPINANFSCPNRDGKKSFDGCVFCDTRSFSPVYDKNEISPVDQLLDVIKNCADKNTYKKFLPYLQPASNTYGSLDKLRDVYESLLNIDDVVGLAIGTRPDCFDDDIYNYLRELAKRTYISIELGLQSGHDKILEKMNRHHTVKDFCDTVHRLNDIGVEVVAHIILGFPDETKEMVRETAELLSSLPINGVKIHQLMIIENTKLANDFYSGLIDDLTIEKYSVLLKTFLGALRKDIRIHRIMADSKIEHGLVSPLWSGDKMKSLEYLKGVVF